MAGGSTSMPEMAGGSTSMAGGSTSKSPVKDVKDELRITPKEKFTNITADVKTVESQLVLGELIDRESNNRNYKKLNGHSAKSSQIVSESRLKEDKKDSVMYCYTVDPSEAGLKAYMKNRGLKDLFSNHFSTPAPRNDHPAPRNDHPAPHNDHPAPQNDGEVVRLLNAILNQLTDLGALLKESLKKKAPGDWSIGWNTILMAAVVLCFCVVSVKVYFTLQELKSDVKGAIHGMDKSWQPPFVIFSSTQKAAECRQNLDPPNA